MLTGALRRRAQILMRRPDLRVEPIRGNVDTRLRKWREQGRGRRDPRRRRPRPPGAPRAPRPSHRSGGDAPGAGPGHARPGGPRRRPRRGALPRPRPCADSARAADGRAPRGGRLRRRLHAPPRRLGPPGGTAGLRADRPPGDSGRPPRRPGRGRGRRSSRGGRRLASRPCGRTGRTRCWRGSGGEASPVRPPRRRHPRRAPGRQLAPPSSAAGAHGRDPPPAGDRAPRRPRPLERAATELALYDWLVFTSANAVEAFMPSTGGPCPRGSQIAVVGPATAEALRAFGIEPHLEAAPSRRRGARGRPRSPGGGAAASSSPRRRTPGRLLAEGSRRPGPRPWPWWPTTSASLRRPCAGPAELFSAHSLGWVTFTSPRIVRHFAELFGDGLGEAARRAAGGLDRAGHQRRAAAPGGRARGRGRAAGG